jgi:hypothetical protein
MNMNLNSVMDNVVLCFIVPPSAERPHSSWRAIVYTREQPEKVFHGTKTLPSKITADTEIMKQEICDPDHIPAHIVQITEKDQYVYIEGDVCEMLSVEVALADGNKDPYLKRCQSAKKAKPKSQSSLILPGQAVPQPSGQAGSLIIGGVSTPPPSRPTGSLEDLYVVDITFKTHEIHDQAIVDHVKSVAWNYGLKY